MKKISQKIRSRIAGGYVIGVDGGGTKTFAALADLEGKILKIAQAGPSSPRNAGSKIAAQNIAKSINKVLKKGKVLSTFIGLAAVEEEPRLKKEVKKEILKQKEISRIFEGKLKIGSDQIIAFRSGTNEKEGILLIAGTGCVVHGWRKDKEVHASGWGWLADEGSAFWVGQRAFQAVFKDLDGRGPRTLITKIVFHEFNIKNEQDLMLKIYSGNPVLVIPFFSLFCDKASRKGDRVARNIMTGAGRELVLSLKTAIKKLNFQRDKFPLVLVGGMFNSGIVLDIVKREIKGFAPKVKFIRLKQGSLRGAVRLAIEEISK